MHLKWGPVCLCLALIAVVVAETTPQPSVEPSSPSTTFSPSSTSEASDLTEEGQDQVAILKQINRVNEDGSYTFGYEAADGSFKIETRDVTGNVKGMFGFVDEGGELKRVSYSASNGTGFQSTGTPNVPPLVRHDDGESTTRIPFSVVSSGDREVTTRISLLPETSTERPALPVYIYKATTRTPRPEVIQHITKLRPTPASFSTEPSESAEVTNIRRPAYGTVLPKKSSTPSYITLRPTTLSADVESEQPTRRPSVVQVIRPRGYKKVLVTKRPITDSSTAGLPTTELNPVTFAPQLEDEEMMDHGDVQRQVDSNSVTEAGPVTSGSEDSPDVFGGGPTSRPFPASAYRTLFPPVPQYQRILQNSFLQNQNQYQAARGNSQLPPPFRADGGPPINPNTPNHYQDPSSGAQIDQFQYGNRGQITPGAVDQVSRGLPYSSGVDGQGLAYPTEPRGPVQGLQYPLGSGGQSLPYPSRPEGQSQGFPYPQGAGVQGRRPYPPLAGGQGQSIYYPGQDSPYPTGAERQYQGLQFPSASGRQNIPPPPGAPVPQDYPQSPTGRGLPSLYSQTGVDGPPYPQDPPQNPTGRQLQTLPAPTYNPAQGLTPVGTSLASRAEAERSQPPPGSIPFNRPYPNSDLNGPAQTNTQSFFMEQLIRMLLAANTQSQSRPQQELSLLQQALIATLRANNVPPELYGQNYDPRYQNYGPYPQRASYYPQPPVDPRYIPYSGYPDLYAQPPYPNRYNPYLSRIPNPYQGYSGYQGYSPNLRGFDPNPYYQFNPEEALIRMFLGPRYPAPAPQPNPQIQTSPAAFDRNPNYIPQQPIGPVPQVIQPPVFGQRIPGPGAIVERSSSYPQIEASSQRLTTLRPKGSRNVQILLEPVTSTTSKPQ